MKTSKITSYFTPSYQNLHAFVCERCDAAQSFNSSTDEDFQVCNSCRSFASSPLRADDEDLVQLFHDTDFEGVAPPPLEVAPLGPTPERLTEFFDYGTPTGQARLCQTQSSPKNLLFSLPTELQREIFDYGKKLGTKKLIDELKSRHRHFNSYVPYLPTYYGKYRASALNHFCHGYRNFMKALDNSNGW